MGLRAPTRWLLLLTELSALGLATWWGADNRVARDFQAFHDWVPAGLVLGLAGLAGFTLWSFYALFPPVLHGVKVISHALAGLLFLATFSAVAMLTEGLNGLGARPAPEELAGTLTRYVSAPRASNGSLVGHYGVVQLRSGLAVDVPRAVLDARRLYLGEEVRVSLHRGNLFDWGLVLPPRDAGPPGMRDGTP